MFIQIKDLKETIKDRINEKKKTVFYLARREKKWEILKSVASTADGIFDDTMTELLKSLPNVFSVREIEIACKITMKGK